jgi:hypothetical protein
MKQTAVEWLIEELSKTDQRMLGKVLLIYNQAKEMEKEQMIDFADGYVDNCVIPNENMAIPTTMDVPHYYNEIYKKD